VTFDPRSETRSVPARDIIAGTSQGHSGAFGAVVAYQHLKRPVRAARSSRREQVAGLVNKAVAAYLRADYAAARDLCQDAMILDKEFPQANEGLGWALCRLGFYREALVFMQRAEKFGGKKDTPDALSMRAACFANLGAVDKAIHLSRKAIKKAPRDPMLIAQLGTHLMMAGVLDEAAREFRRAIAQAGMQEMALNNLALIAKDQASYRWASTLTARINAITVPPAGVAKNDVGSYLYWPRVDMKAYAHAQRRWAKRYAVGGSLNAGTGRKASAANGTIRVALISSDLRNHPVGRNFLGIFEGMSNVEWHVFSNHAEGVEVDPVTARYKQHALASGGRFLRTDNAPDSHLAHDIYRANCDAVIYLALRMDQNRGQVAAFRAAPVQISYLDVGAANIPGIDYSFLAADLYPRTGGEPADERVIRLPRFYQHMDLPPVHVMPPPCLNGNPFTFGSFNNSAKVNDEVLVVWSRILDEVPGSRLVLKYKRSYASADVQRRVAASLPEGRVVFELGSDSIDEHLASYEKMDLALDPFAFNGSTTTFDALWMGVPVVTLEGVNIMGRYGRMIMRQVGLPQFVHTSIDSYVEQAVFLARNPILLAAMRACLRESTQRALCRPTARYFERALRAIVKKAAASRS